MNAEITSLIKSLANFEEMFAHLQFTIKGYD